MSDGYDARQTSFALNMCSNLGSDMSGLLLARKTLKAIRAQLRTYKPNIGSWEVVWGPSVFRANPLGKPDNTMYVAHNPDTGAYQVCIAGTNPHTSFGWVVEDFMTATAWPWAYGTPPEDALIARGTLIGLTILQTMVPGPGTTGAREGVREFLAGVASAATGDFELTVAGHSLGGALSPAFALWLEDTRDEWDPNGRATLWTRPTAGPTPGNSSFATYITERLGDRLCRVMNHIDVVPHAWAVSDLEQVPGIYEPAIPVLGAVKALTAAAIFNTHDIDYQQIGNDPDFLPGQVDTSLITHDPPNVTDFLVQLGHQHVAAYFELLGVEPTGGSTTAATAVAGMEASGLVKNLVEDLSEDIGEDV